MNTIFRLALFGALGLLAACSFTPTEDENRPLEIHGDYSGNAKEYQRRAESASGRMRSDYLLSAAEAWLQAKQLSEAAAAVRNARPDPRDLTQTARARLLAARVAQAQERSNAVLSALEGLPQPATPTATRLQVAELRSWALLTQGQGTAAARVLADAAPLLVDPDSVRTNRKALWEALRTVSDSELLDLAASPHPILGPWAELALLQRTQRNAGGLESAVQSWRQRHRVHPVTQDLITELLSQPLPPPPPPVPVPPTQVALLLPSEGPAAKAAAAVQDGFLAAWYVAPPSDRPTLIFQPFTRGAIRTAYQTAVRAGAALIVGPLGKDEVQSLTQDPISRTTLALNYLPEKTTAPAHLYQFGLAPEDEARQIAQQAWLEGRTHAFTVTQKGDWGDRVVQAFQAQWETLGGTLARTLIAESTPEELSAALRTSVSTTSDFIFLATPPEPARQLVPVLREARLAVYATSHVLSGTDQDAVLGDFKVLELPWMVAPDSAAASLRTELERLWPGDFLTYRRLYALGVDAFRLTGELAHLESDPSARLAGTTGSLALDPGRRIVRQAVWAQVSNGRLVPVAP